MTTLLKAFLFLCCLFIAHSTVLAKVDVVRFETSQQEELYKEMIAELRCLVCQNQNLADSNAELAQDLRRKTHDLIIQGKDKSEIVDFMVSRYGDFVLYRPRVKGSTLVLWVAPFFLILLVIIIFVKTHKKTKVESDYSPEQLDKAAQLLRDNQ